MLAAGRKTLTEVFDLTFIPLLAGSSSSHTHTKKHTILNLHFSLLAWISPRNMEIHFSHRGLSSQNGGSQLQNVAAPTSLYIAVLKLMCMFVCFWVLWYNLCEPPTLFLVIKLEHSSLYKGFAFVSPVQLKTMWIKTIHWAAEMLQVTFRKTQTDIHQAYTYLICVSCHYISAFAHHSNPK